MCQIKFGKMKKLKFDTILDVFNILNVNNVPYVVLRNYENLLETEMYVEGHGDVDMLCADSQEIVKLLGAETTRKDHPPFIGDGTHYYIYVGDEKCSLDLRYVGDDYYCKKWEEDVLSNRVLNNGFYVMNEENYFYTLIYHSILQKQKLSDDYLKRLSAMARKLQKTMDGVDEKAFIKLLNEYMRDKKYHYTYPVDFCVPCRFYLVDKSLVLNNWKRIFIHKKYEFYVLVIDFLVWVKHCIIKK